MSATDAPRRKTFSVNLGAEAVAASTPYVLVDLSDTTNFPHADTNWINLLGLVLSAVSHTDGVFDIWVGVVTENDATDGSVDWMYVFHVENRNDAIHEVVDFTLGNSNPDGINCQVSSGSLMYFAGNQSQADSVNWQNDTNRTSPVGTTTRPGVGDLVVWVEEVTDGGTLDFSLTAIYEAH